MRRRDTTSDEEILWSGNPSKRVAILAPLFYLAIVVGAWVYDSSIYSQGTYILERVIGRSNRWTELFPFLVAALPVLYGLWGYLLQVTTKYTCTTERLIINHGILVRTEDEVELYRVVDVVQTVSILQRLVGVGTVVVKSTDQTGSPRLGSITRPSMVRNLIRTAAEQCKTQRGTLRVLNEAAGF